jgi:type II secretory pathway component PulF
MPEFTYEAMDKAGKATMGTIAARDSQDAAIKVRQLGVYPTRIGTGNGKAVTNGNGHAAKNSVGATLPLKRSATNAAAATQTAATGTKGGKKITRVQLLLFTREMSDLLEAGLPMDRAFSVLIDQTDSDSMRAMLMGMQGDIRAGQPLSDALKKFPREFTGLYANMVHAGEVSGQLASVMTRLADFMEKEQVRRSQVMAALTYPLVLVGVAVLAVTFLLVWVIPMLSGVFKDLGSSLPLPTVILLGLSAFVKSYWYLIIIAIVGTVFGFRSWVRTPSGHFAFDRFRLKLPMFGILIQKIVAARLVRTLGTLLGGGVPILESMDIAASALGNVVAEEAVLSARSGVRNGETLHESMGKTGAFLPVVMHMTAVGEETGRLPNMLLRTADTLDFEVDNTMRRLTSLVEPLVVLLMGGFVGFVVLSILLPIFKSSTLAK